MAGFYNRTFYNRRGGAQQFPAAYVLYGNLTANMQAGMVNYVSYKYSGALGAKMTLWWGFDEHYALAGTLTATAKMHANMTAAYAMAGEMTARLCPVIEARYKLSGALNGNAKLTVGIYPKFSTFYGVLTAYIDGTQTREYVMSFPDLTIPAGGTLVIDSEVYTATLDGVNVIDKYSGVWIELTRKLHGMDVNAGTSGTLGVSVLYRDKYL